MDQALADDIASKLKDYDRAFDVHQKMFDIYDGNLSHHLDEWLAGQLSPSAARYAQLRKAPINILKKIVDKLSTIYQQSPSRRIVDGTPRDADMLSLYEDYFRINTKLNLGNEFLNMCRATLIQPYVHEGLPRLRCIPNHQFFVYSDDQIDPLNPTHILTCQERMKDRAGNTKTVWHVWSDSEFAVMSSDGEILRNKMADLGFEDGVNPIGKIPFVYVNRSSTCIVPKPDIDMLNMTLLIPGIITDLNYASMFSLFSVLYGIDVEASKMELAPNAFWFLQSDPDTDKKPEIGSIRPEASVTDTLELVKSQLAFWLQTKNIKPGTVGDVEGSSFASAVSKMVDEADTSDERKKQVEYFTQAETDLWDLVLQHLHPYWVSNRQMPPAPLFSVAAYVETRFSEQIPLFNRGDVVRNLEAEVSSGFTSRRRAIKHLNPQMTDDDIDELIAEIDEEVLVKAPLGIRFEMFELGEAVDGTTEG